MIVIDDIGKIDLETPNAVTIGIFDGFHLGHQKIAAKTVSVAETHNIGTVLVTFEQQTDTPRYLTTMDEKLVFFEKRGFDKTVILRAQGNWKKWDPETFIKGFLINKLNTRFVIVGSDFRFGKNRIGDVGILKEYADTYDLISVDLEQLHDLKISSTEIRQLIQAGDVETASKLLGKPYFFTGDTISGKGIGTKLGFPTVNFNIPPGKLLPVGIFSAFVILKNRGKAVRSACFIGDISIDNKRSAVRRSIEVHMLDYMKGYENQVSRVELVKKIREPLKFDDMEQLRRQIADDIHKISLS
ncbi:MAG: riboflavin biosynthesis protein RibF [Elusimicrobiota bacterium]